MLTILTSVVLSSLMSGNPFAEKKAKTSGFVGDIINSFQYDLNVTEKKNRQRLRTF